MDGGAYSDFKRKYQQDKNTYPNGYIKNDAFPNRTRTTDPVGPVVSRFSRNRFGRMVNTRLSNARIEAYKSSPVIRERLRKGHEKLMAKLKGTSEIIPQRQPARRMSPSIRASIDAVRKLRARIEDESAAKRAATEAAERLAKEAATKALEADVEAKRAKAEADKAAKKAEDAAKAAEAAVLKIEPAKKPTKTPQTKPKKGETAAQYWDRVNRDFLKGPPKPKSTLSGLKGRAYTQEYERLEREKIAPAEGKRRHVPRTSFRGGRLENGD